MSENHPWRLRVYRWTSLEGPVEDRPMECLVDVPLDESWRIEGMDLKDTHGSIEQAVVQPAKTLREIGGAPGSDRGNTTVIGHTFRKGRSGPGCLRCGWPKENHLA